MTDDDLIPWDDPADDIALQSSPAFVVGEQDLLIVDASKYKNANDNHIIRLNVKSVTHSDSPVGVVFLMVMNADGVRQIDNIITVKTIGTYVGADKTPHIDNEFALQLIDKRFHATVTKDGDFLNLSKIEAIDTPSQPTPEPEADLLDDDIPF